jgi:hypothetical protein
MEGSPHFQEWLRGAMGLAPTAEKAGNLRRAVEERIP